MRKLYLVRHMETVWNEQQRYIGVTDLPLSAAGVKYAEALADFLKGKPVKKLFSSQMLRAKQTANILAKELSCSVMVEPLLNEIDFGDWEGLTFNEIATSYEELSKAWLKNPFAVNIPGGESWDSFVIRVRKGWEKVKKVCVNESVLVTHAGCIKLILSWELNIELEKGWQIKQDKGAINILDLNKKGQAKVLTLNSTAYRQAKIIS